MKEKVIKAINFDIDTHKLKEYYPGKHHKNGYADIRAFFEKNGFYHRQRSGYCSDKKLSDTETYQIVENLIATLPWLSECVRIIDVTNADDVHNLNFMLKPAEVKANEKVSAYEPPAPKLEPPKTMSASEWKAEIAAVKATHKSDSKPEEKSHSDKER